MVQQSRRGELLRLLLDGWGRSGEALALHDGMEVSVFGGIPGERVVVEVVRHRRDYIAARVVEVLEPSPHRVSPPCAYFGECTGCQWQHIDYQHQVHLKRQVVVDALSRIGGFDIALVSPTVESPEQYGYRNHARFTVGRREGELGFVNRESSRFVPIQQCLLMHPWIGEALAKLQGRCGETSQLSLRYGVNTGDFLIQPALKNQDVSLTSGQKHYTERLDGRVFRIASPSFFQVNTHQAARMAGLVRDELQPSGNGLLVDAYAGVGTFAILLASYAAKVIAIEEAASAVQDAAVNAEGLDSVQFLLGKTEEMLDEIVERPEGVILDPPRAGCHPKVLAALVRLAPRRIVYVSCDPGTLARDLKTLCEGPFRLEHVQPIDMFPQTHHVECIATLSWTGYASDADEQDGADASAGKDELVLASTSPRRRELLSGLGVGFSVVPPSGSEDPQPHEPPQQMVERLALLKARSVAQSLRGGAVVAADSVVVIDGRVLGKPADAAAAYEMLEGLRGRQHQVMSGVAVVNARDGTARAASQISQVTLRDYSNEEIEAYVRSGGPLDKAGAYAVQDRVFHPAAQLEGCYSNVVGLPLCLLVDLLHDAGFSVGPVAGIRVPEGCSECPLAGTQ